MSGASALCWKLVKTNSITTTHSRRHCRRSSTKECQDAKSMHAMCLVQVREAKAVVKTNTSLSSLTLYVGTQTPDEPADANMTHSLDSFAYQVIRERPRHAGWAAWMGWERSDGTLCVGHIPSIQDTRRLRTPIHLDEERTRGPPGWQTTSYPLQQRLNLVSRSTLRTERTCRRNFFAFDKHRAIQFPFLFQLVSNECLLAAGWKHKMWWTARARKNAYTHIHCLSRSVCKQRVVGLTAWLQKSPPRRRQLAVVRLSSVSGVGKWSVDLDFSTQSILGGYNDTLCTNPTKLSLSRMC